MKDLMLFGKRSKSLAEDEDMVKNKKVVPFLEECPVEYNRDAFLLDIDQEFELKEEYNKGEVNPLLKLFGSIKSTKSPAKNMSSNLGDKLKLNVRMKKQEGAEKKHSKEQLEKLKDKTKHLSEK